MNPTLEDSKATTRLFGLDAARGLAALAVVIFHWQLWGRPAPAAGDPSVAQRLGGGALEFFYQCGGTAVSLFFVLSGFVFFWLFREGIESKRVNGRQFALDRFSRLYPLYVATLAWAWGGHSLFAWLNQGPHWDPGVNTVGGFVNQLLVVPLWFSGRVLGFNLPSWSLPIEALMYLIFFALARSRRLHVGATVAMALLGAVVACASPDIGDAMTTFFMGGLCFLASEQLPGAPLERALRLLLAVSWPLAIVFGSGLIDIARTRLAFLDHHYAILVLYPATVLYLAVLERRRGALARRWSWLGDATYAMYLLHYPLMLTTAIVFRAMGWNFDLLKSPIALATFIALVVPLSVACHRWFERPLQDAIRRRGWALVRSPAPD